VCGGFGRQIGMVERTSIEGALRPLRDIGWTPGAIIDIGVAEGTTGLYTVWPGVPICLIEPSPDAAPFMRRIAEAHPNVQIYNVGASNRSGVMDVYKHPSLLNVFFGTGKAHWVPAKVPVRTCDDIVADAGLKGPFVYKLDTDSHEREILEGSEATLAATDLCIIEFNVFYPLRGLCPPNEIWRSMAAHGFTLFDAGGFGYAESGLMRAVDLVFVREDSELFRLAFSNSEKQLKKKTSDALTI
jgi:FkbM family methyltransferase